MALSKLSLIRPKSDMRKAREKEEKMEKTTVSQFYNKNQFIITTPTSYIFQSYESTIAVSVKYGKLTVGRRWDYSHTTTTHFYKFLEDYAPSIYAKISDKSNKRAAFQKLIDEKQVDYNEDLV